MIPCIGITSEFDPREKDPRKGRLQLEHEYADAVLAAGGMPFALPVPAGDEPLPAYVERLDGFVFTGGRDLPAAAYGAENHPETKELPQRRTDWDLGLIRAVYRARKPMLCICLGIQEFNVALGGSLHQHLETGLRHARDESGMASHPIRIVDPGSRLREVLGADELEVNSSHHQAIDRLGEGLRIVARAPDGTVEAVEPNGEAGFVLAVQWHPERIADRPEQLALFRALVDAAARQER